jgi:hypothetical protein
MATTGKAATVIGSSTIHWKRDDFGIPTEAVSYKEERVWCLYRHFLIVVIDVLHAEEIERQVESSSRPQSSGMLGTDARILFIHSRQGPSPLADSFDRALSLFHILLLSEVWYVSQWLQ